MFDDEQRAILSNSLRCALEYVNSREVNWRLKEQRCH